MPGLAKEEEEKGALAAVDIFNKGNYLNVMAIREICCVLVCITLLDKCAMVCCKHKTTLPVSITSVHCGPPI